LRAAYFKKQGANQKQGRREEKKKTQSNRDGRGDFRIVELEKGNGALCGRGSRKRGFNFAAAWTTGDSAMGPGGVYQGRMSGRKWQWRGRVPMYLIEKKGGEKGARRAVREENIYLIGDRSRHRRA